MFGQNADLQKLVVLNNNVLMQLVQYVGSLQVVQAGTVDAKGPPVATRRERQDKLAKDRR